MKIREKIEKFVEKKIEKTMRKKRNYYRKNGKDVTFSIWWWIAKNIQSQDKLRTVCLKMARYFERNEEKQDLSSLISMGISDIVVVGNTIFIYLQRPGLIVGNRGVVIDSLIKRINYIDYGEKKGEKEFDYNISLVEDNVSGTRWIKRFFENYYD